MVENRRGQINKRVEQAKIWLKVEDDREITKES